MEHLTQEQLQGISKEELATRFNILVQQMAGVQDEIKGLPAYPKGFTAFNGSDISNRYLRIIDKLTRPFAGTQYSHNGVKAITVPNA